VTVEVAGNEVPEVSLVPMVGAFDLRPAQIRLTATADDHDGTVTQVVFFADSTQLGTATSAPYTVTWQRPAAGTTFAVTAVAYDDEGAVTTSSPMTVAIPANQAPSASIVSPASATLPGRPAEIQAVAAADDADGTIARVEFFANDTLFGVAIASPYSAVLKPVLPGTYVLKVVAHDDEGATATSAPVTVIVPANKAPVVALLSPANGASVQKHSSVTLTASATDADGAIAKVEFYAGATLIGSDVQAPYSITWTNVPSGYFALTAVAYDDEGLTTGSSPVAITVPELWLATFTPSVDHASNVDRYVLELFTAGASSPVVSYDMGKPALAGTDVTVDVSTLIAALPAGTYTGKVKAVNTFGTSTSDALTLVRP
jgi:hypothetical protein